MKENCTYCEHIVKSKNNNFMNKNHSEAMNDRVENTFVPHAKN